ncbi:putative PIG3 family NAD(P)H quinone oxidoreductase [Stackebrandtia endophytica]|uniref:Putative PIG3 family NAD(P)H quinone oxidoreductase n=1 Tax=Stackebrandtia endophytica TaxID=1496996 RepID=A0A543AX74_9ACTN|nr:NAD(P)H-quinone oxidoreductase [Stackebrandtia endophytica]TQL77172.1 putative PIG3 family NAD(P)H quinone oxidoreductase [Stackebrandtia endophytica]
MYAVEISEPGGPQVLRWRETPEVVPGPGEVLIEVAAAGVNRADLLQRQGHYPPPAGASEVPGLECSGTVAAVGEDVTAWQVGDRVCALLSGGGYAERVVVDAGLVLPVPTGVDLVDAAGLPEAAATVWSNVFDIAELDKGQSILVHGGAGGIGTVAIQLATVFGARVLTTARADHADALRRLGAELIIDYRDEDFVAVVADHTDNRGVDVILDNMGASYLERNIKTLAFGGRLAVIGMQGGRSATLNLGALLVKRGRISAAGLRARPLIDRIRIIDAVAREVWPLVARQLVKPVVAQRIPLSEAPAAHEAMEAGGHLGKILLTR